MTDSAKGRVPILAAGGVVLRGMTRPRIAVVRLRHEKAWVLPKGKLFPREHARDAAVREVAEETGYDVSVHQFLGSMSYVVVARL
jgi:8-oxo-dGTP diphosphatase